MNIHHPQYHQVGNLENEQWRPIPDFEDYYEVSSEGRIRSKDRYMVNKLGRVYYIRPKILTPNKTSKESTPSITLASCGTEKHHYCRSIRALVADAFLQKEGDNIHLTTIDDPNDFAADNLIYVTLEEIRQLCD